MKFYLEELFEQNQNLLCHVLDWEELFEQNQNLLCHVLDCKYLILRWGRRGVQEGPGKHCGERHGEAP
jgi:hypothetical protein